MVGELGARRSLGEEVGRRIDGVRGICIFGSRSWIVIVV